GGRRAVGEVRVMKSSLSRVPVSPRVLLAGLALVALGLANAASHGFYTHAAILGALLALRAALIACTRRTHPPLFAPPLLGSAALVGVALFLAAHGTVRDWSSDWVRLLPLPGVVLVLGAMLTGRLRPHSLSLAVLAAAGLLLGGKA